METLYWICEYGKVFCGYMFFMFLWPSVVFSKHLKNKDKIYHFSFCVLVQVVIANSVVLSLGLLHILNRWVVCCIFYGIFFINVLRKLSHQYQSGSLNEIITSSYRLIMGTLRIKSFLYLMVKKIGDFIKDIFSRFWSIIRIHLMEYFILFIVVVYGMIYFSYGVFQDYNYGFGDMYVHHQWIYGLIEGNIFFDGVYPEAMHCFIYCLHVLFRIKVYSCILFLAGIHVSIFLISAYGLLKEVFEWKFTPIFVLIMFLTLDLLCIDIIYSMSRLQWTIPQEFSLYTQFLCALYLIRYLNSSHTITFKNKIGKYFWDENLLLFMMSLAASISIHFYSTIMAFFLCLSFAIFALKKILKKERFFPLVAAVLCGFFIAVMPMIGALVSGIPFQGSIGWAVGVINSEENEIDETEGTTLQKESEEIEKITATDDDKSFVEKLKRKIFALYWYGYGTLYREERAHWIIALTMLDVILCISYQIIKTIYHIVSKRQLKGKYFNEYIPLVLASVLYMIIYASPGLGIPPLIAGSRLCTSEQILLLAVITMPIDMFFTLLSRFCIDCILQVLSLFATVGICSSTVILGNYHGYLYCELTRYNAAIKVTESIMSKFPQYSYTIVSTSDEIYQVIQCGRHEELLTFLQEIEKNDYTLPTEYVFLYVEKKPIEYGQSHFFQGPAWLAEEKYVDIFSAFGNQCPKIRASDISAEEAQKDILLYSRPSLSYTKNESRTILESKAYLWCQNFSKLHPFKVYTYYEDEDFMCYYFEQNPYALYNLSIEDWNRMDGIQW